MRTAPSFLDGRLSPPWRSDFARPFGILADLEKTTVNILSSSRSIPVIHCHFAVNRFQNLSIASKTCQIAKTCQLNCRSCLPHSHGF